MANALPNSGASSFLGALKRKSVPREFKRKSWLHQLSQLEKEDPKQQTSLPLQSPGAGPSGSQSPAGATTAFMTPPTRGSVPRKSSTASQSSAASQVEPRIASPTAPLPPASLPINHFIPTSASSSVPSKRGRGSSQDAVQHNTSTATPDRQPKKRKISHPLHLQERRDSLGALPSQSPSHHQDDLRRASEPIDPSSGPPIAQSPRGQVSILPTLSAAEPLDPGLTSPGIFRTDVSRSPPQSALAHPIAPDAGQRAPTEETLIIEDQSTGGASNGSHGGHSPSPPPSGRRFNLDLVPMENVRHALRHVLQLTARAMDPSIASTEDFEPHVSDENLLQLAEKFLEMEDLTPQMSNSPEEAAGTLQESSSPADMDMSEDEGDQAGMLTVSGEDNRRSRSATSAISRRFQLRTVGNSESGSRASSVALTPQITPMVLPIAAIHSEPSDVIHTLESPSVGLRPITGWKVHSKKLKNLLSSLRAMNIPGPAAEASSSCLPADRSASLDPEVPRSGIGASLGSSAVVLESDPPIPVDVETVAEVQGPAGFTSGSDEFEVSEADMNALQTEAPSEHTSQTVSYWITCSAKDMPNTSNPPAQWPVQLSTLMLKLNNQQLDMARLSCTHARKPLCISKRVLSGRNSLEVFSTDDISGWVFNIQRGRCHGKTPLAGQPDGGLSDWFKCLDMVAS